MNKYISKGKFAGPKNTQLSLSRALRNHLFIDKLEINEIRKMYSNISKKSIDVILKDISNMSELDILNYKLNNTPINTKDLEFPIKRELNSSVNLSKVIDWNNLNGD